MFGTGIGHYIPLAVYLGLWIMTLVSLGGKPLFGLYFMMPLLPYRTLRDRLHRLSSGRQHADDSVLAVIVGAIIHGKRLPKSKLYSIWLVYGVYLYFSVWLKARKCTSSTLAF